MSSIIQTVSYEVEKSKNLLEKLVEHLGVHKLDISLLSGEKIEGIVSEVGCDYISVLGDQCDILIPINQISVIKYQQ